LNLVGETLENVREGRVSDCVLEDCFTRVKRRGP
ncbi:MAG: hypothetical protein RL326_1561, partial [Pseudomonadota bacterium]